MKRIIAILLCFVMVFALASCAQKANTEAPESTETTEPESVPNEQPEPEAPADETPSNDAVEQESETPEESSGVVVDLEPVVYSGSGNSVIDVDADGKAYVFHITGNEDDRHFSVKAYNADGTRKTLLVNKSDPYDGITVDTKFETASLEITATGDWTVELVPLASCPNISSGQTVTGTNDAVIIVKDSGKTASISGNDSDKHFAVKAYDGNGRYDLMVNATDPYEGTVMIENDPVLLTVTSVGDWSITFD